MRLIRKDGGLFATKESGEFIGKIINDISGDCHEHPINDDPDIFSRVFGGKGDIYHVCDTPPNPFFNHSWSEVFENPELLPTGTKNVFIDQSQDAALDFRSERMP